MNFNILSYAIYALLTVYIIVYVGKLFHRNGRIFILALFNQDISTADTTNNLLLAGYYLLNIGYAILQFSFWNTIHTVSELLAGLAHKTGMLVVLLAILHYLNMFTIYILSKNKFQSYTIKK